MVLRLFLFSAIAFVALGLVSSPAIAESPRQDASEPTIEQDQKTVSRLPTTDHRAKLCTRDRWRGKPYLRSGDDETLRSHVLDTALPPANPAFQGGASLTVLGR
jgi:hypothetical protein